MDYIMNTYGRFPLTLTKGEGMYVYDNNGKKYLDFVAGIAVNALGHCHPVMVDAIKKQAETLIHVSNLYYTEPQINLAKKLVENSCFSKVFFCNSGAEGIEGAIKLARKFGAGQKFEIITMNNSFHGRTLGALTATGQHKYQKGFGPLLPGVKYADFNDIDSVKAQITEQTAAIIVEPVQGEGGITPAATEFLKGLRELCDKHDMLLIFDEIQCGMGRLGTLFAYQTFGIEPDVAVIAKGIAGGFPMGAILSNERADVFVPGEHASTFGGNPLAAASANAVVGYMLETDLLNNVKVMGEYLGQKLSELANHRKVKEVRGVGLMQGIELHEAAAPVISACMENSLLLVGAGPNIVRFVPPLVVEKAHIDEMIEILTGALNQ